MVYFFIPPAPEALCPTCSRAFGPSEMTLGIPALRAPMSLFSNFVYSIKLSSRLTSFTYGRGNLPSAMVLSSHSRRSAGRSWRHHRRRRPTWTGARQCSLSIRVDLGVARQFNQLLHQSGLVLAAALFRHVLADVRDRLHHALVNLRSHRQLRKRLLQQFETGRNGGHSLFRGSRSGRRHRRRACPCRAMRHWRRCAACSTRRRERHVHSETSLMQAGSRLPTITNRRSLAALTALVLAATLESRVHGSLLSWFGTNAQKTSLTAQIGIYLDILYRVNTAAIKGRSGSIP